MSHGTGPGAGKSSGGKNTGNSKLIDLNQVRAQKLDEKRRKTERVFFKQLLGVYSVIGDEEMLGIELIEVSEDGLSFQVPFDAKNPWPTTESSDIPVRLYFSQDSFLTVNVRIQNANPSIEDGARFMRYGCAVDKTYSSYPAYQSFVRFLKAYTEYSQKDKGDLRVTFR